MASQPRFTTSGGDPLRSDDSADWGRLIEAVGPAAMLVRIHARMGAALRRRTSAEDLWQETLLHAWRDRERCQWRGVNEFRRWLVQVAENRIRDAADREGAQKRGGGGEVVLSSLRRPGPAGSESSLPPDPLVSTTPSRIARHAEEARCMRAALESLPEELREVVRLRLFEERGLEGIASALGLGPAAVKHRLRKGAALYRQRLASEYESRLGGSPGDSSEKA